MSALSSGSFEDADLYYRRVASKPADLGEPFLGACYRQKADICWVPNRAYEQWVVVAFNDETVTLQPGQGPLGSDRWINGTRTLSKSVLRTEYQLCKHQRQRPPC